MPLWDCQLSLQGMVEQVGLQSSWVCGLLEEDLPSLKWLFHMNTLRTPGRPSRDWKVPLPAQTFVFLLLFHASVVVTPISKCLLSQLQRLWCSPQSCLVQVSAGWDLPVSPAVSLPAPGALEGALGQGREGRGPTPAPNGCPGSVLKLLRPQCIAGFAPTELWGRCAAVPYVLCIMYGLGEGRGDENPHRIVSLAMATKNKSLLCHHKYWPWQENRSTMYLLFIQNLFAPWLFFPFFLLSAPIRSPLGVSISIMCSVLHWGVRGISCPSVLCQMAQIMCSASSGGILISSALVHGSGVGLVPAQLSPGVSDKHATCGSEQCFEVVLLCQILIRDENVFENDGRKMCCSSLDKTLWGSVCYVEQPEVRSGPAAIWQLRKGSRDVELRPLTAESKTKSLLLRGRVKSHFCLRARFICTIKWLCLWLVEKHAII